MDNTIVGDTASKSMEGASPLCSWRATELRADVNVAVGESR